MFVIFATIGNGLACSLLSIITNVISCRAAIFIPYFLTKPCCVGGAVLILISFLVTEAGCSDLASLLFENICTRIELRRGATRARADDVGRAGTMILYCSFPLSFYHFCVTRYFRRRTRLRSSGGNDEKMV
jgi:hypothetical protein